MSNSVKGSFLSSLQKIDNMYNSIRKDKNDRATVEQVLDPRTLIILHKLIQNNKIEKLYGCVSTGKEANVYLTEGRCKDFNTLEMIPEGEPNIEYAVKIFKTSILVFKDRERYVEGEFRFRRGHCKGNPRKKVKLWAEKEVRNLKRICMSGKIRAPTPHYLKNNVIVMEFIGENGQAAPRLKDAIIGKDDELEAAHLYEECIIMMRNLYQDCKLVHGDLSEYNLLYHKGEIWMIDVSQSVEYDHPMALDFLRRDCSVMNEFFKKNKVYVLTTVKLFNFITDTSITGSKLDAVVSNLLKEAQNGYSQKDLENDKVFEQIYIPRSLQELNEVDIYKEQNFGTKEFLKNMTQFNDGGAGVGDQGIEGLEYNDNDSKEIAEYKNKQVVKRMLEENAIKVSDDVEEGKEREQSNEANGDKDEQDEADNDSEGDDSDGSDGDSDDNSDQDHHRKKKNRNGEAELGVFYDSDDNEKQNAPVSLAGMTKEQKKAHKAKVKEENREKRKNKMSKYDKKKAMNKGKFKK